MSSLFVRVLGTFVGLTLVVGLTFLVFGLDLGLSFKVVTDGAFGGEIGWSRTLVNMTPLLLTGLGITVAWKAGMYNIGGEGQYIVGGLLGAATARFLPVSPGPGLAAIILLATAVGGALYASLATWLQIKRGVQVVISTILLNFVALQLLAWSVGGPLRDPSSTASQTAELPATAMLARWSVRTDLHFGVVLGILVAVLIWIYMRWTVGGFRLRLTGENERAARAASMDTSQIRLKAMALSGALCGLAGGIQFVGISGVIDAGFNQQWGFLGIPVALLGGLNALGVLASAFYFGALFAGTQALSRTTPGGDLLIFVVQGVSVLAFILIQRSRVVIAKRREVHV